MYCLLVVEGPDSGARFPLPDREPQLIGRSTEAVPLHDDSVSRRHAELTPDEGRWWIRDLDSSNGTWINDLPVTDRTPLAPGDRIRCGDTILVLVRDEEVGPGGSIRAADPARVRVQVLPESAPKPMADARLLPLFELIHDPDEADVPDLSEGLARVSARMLDADAGATIRLDDHGGAVTAPVVRDRDGRPPSDLFNLPRALVIETLGSDGPRVAIVDEGPTIAAVTLRAGGMPPSMLAVSRPGDRPWGEADLDLLALIGRVAALLLATADRRDHASRTERLAAMGEAIAALSHSIKNILQGLRGGADAMELALDRENLGLARDGWKVMARNLDRILALSLNMLVYSKERGLDLESRTCGDVVSDVVALVEAGAHRRGVEIACEFDPDEPPILIDADALHQAMLNLVGNAIDAVEGEPGPMVRISTRFDPIGDRVTIDVTDDGPGIPADRRSRIFEPFFSTKGQRGTGLGLAVARKLVHKHGGEVDLVEENRAGATFRVTLPASRDDEPDAAGTRGPRPLPDGDLGVAFE
ncbi:MAG: FHA domain-containing protein [Phycisphaera sp.]|nr:FHA domain-containing protein [Phycisphaera sp.]